MQKIKEQLAELLKKAGFDVSASDFVLPPDIKMGDLALPCFNLAKKMKKAPGEVGAEILLWISHPGIVERAEIVGPYVNFTFKRKWLLEQILCSRQCRDEIYLVSTGGKKIMVEYSQPNTHKEFHVGHLRNACLGAALVNILRAQGNKVITANYIGDTGVHVAKCLWALKKLHPYYTPPRVEEGKWLGKVYVEGAAAAENDLSAKPEMAAVLRGLEARDSEWFPLFLETREWSLQGFRKIYDDLTA